MEGLNLSLLSLPENPNLTNRLEPGANCNYDALISVKPINFTSKNGEVVLNVNMFLKKLKLCQVPVAIFSSLLEWLHQCTTVF